MPFFATPMPARSALREQLLAAYCQNETACLQQLLDRLQLTEQDQQQIENIAVDLVQTVRAKARDKGGVDALMTHYNLSSEEGILLMCLAEALLRIPDKETEDLLIKDKLSGANWEKHLGASESRFVNMATWGLAFTGKVLADQKDSGCIKKVWYGLLSRCGEPVIREAIRRTMKNMSEHFVLGRTIQEALSRSKTLAKKGYLFSYDMLGEMARTEAQADHYFKAYQRAIDAIGDFETDEDNEFLRPTISIKLSALYPRYEFTHRETAIPFLTKQLKTLALAAKSKGIQLTVDAEEAARLDMSLDIFEAVFADPDFAGWEGLGLAVQAYQKRCYPLLQWLIELARTHRKRIGVRLVKGAYWDTEIKVSQVNGFENYPVFTRKAATDVSYLVCAELLLAAQDAIYPKFATHNAYTAAAIIHMTQGKNLHFEFQNLQGMGGPLHGVLVDREKYGLKSRIYAPVGRHEDLLPYLVRRLLENGANTSFVHQIADSNIPIHDLTESPIEKVRDWQCQPNPHIPLPLDIYGERANSKGFDVTREDKLQKLAEQMTPWESHSWQASIANKRFDLESTQQILNPNSQDDVVGYVALASEDDIKAGLLKSQNAFAAWDQLGIENRADLLLKTADLIERDFAEYIVLLRREAGKTFFDAVAEIREAVDFCRYYAQQAKLRLSPEIMPGPTGESNTLRYHGLGTIACISPWNFPLAIFTGQIAASLVAGNCVIAKPAAQTPLLAAKTIHLFHLAGVPNDVVQLMPASGRMIGEVLLPDQRISGVVFTGSTSTAKTIQRTLAQREGEIVPLIAETGGINAMIVDSSALLEQLVMDVMQSAFGSTGQRCSALRVLFVQSDIADNFIDMLKGAMQTWAVGNSALFTNDVGPVIDRNAQAELQAHIDAMSSKAKLIAQIDLPKDQNNGVFVAPTAFELPDLSLLTKEVFGPVLHVIRYQRKHLDQVVNQINALGYGLTFGIQSRIDTTIDRLQNGIKAGNIYVNRNMIGAVVGVQPFGGCRLSGTGPKAGGPNYLLRLCRESTLTINTTAAGGNAQLLGFGDE